MSVTPVVFYIFTGLAGYSVDPVNPRISRGARKLARTPRVIKKKQKNNNGLSQFHESNLGLNPWKCETPIDINIILFYFIFKKLSLLN